MGPTTYPFPYIHAVNTPEDELASFATRWDEAMVGNEPEEIGAFMADQWLLVGGTGITKKADFLARIASGDLTHDRMDADEMHVRLHGDTGTVIARGTSAGYYKGERFSLYEWSTSVFLRVNGGWKCVLTMLAPAEASPEA